MEHHAEMGEALPPAPGVPVRSRPNSKDPAAPVMVRLSAAERSELEAKARAWGVGQSEVMRRGLALLGWPDITPTDRPEPAATPAETHSPARELKVEYDD